MRISYFQKSYQILNHFWKINYVTPNLRVCAINNSPKYKCGKVNETDVLVAKWKLFTNKEKNHYEAAKPRKSTIQKTKIVTKHSYSHIPDAVVIHLTLTRIYTWMLPKQTSCLKESSMDSFNLEFLSKLDFNGLIKSHK